MPDEKWVEDLRRCIQRQSEQLAAQRDDAAAMEKFRAERMAMEMELRVMRIARDDNSTKIETLKARVRELEFQNEVLREVAEEEGLDPDSRIAGEREYRADLEKVRGDEG